MDTYTPWGAVSAIVAGIVFLRVFFTLWGPLDKKMSGGSLDIGHAIPISALKDASVNVRFKSGFELCDVALEGYCTTHDDAPYNFKQLLILRDRTGKRYYARIEEIECFEQVVNAVL